MRPTTMMQSMERLRHGSRVGVGIVASLSVVAALTGCSGSPAPTTASSTQPLLQRTPVPFVSGSPDSSVVCTKSNQQGEPCAGWGASGQILLVTWGGGNCPWLPVAVTTASTQHVTIVTALTGGPSCTADHVPATSSVSLPPGVKDSLPVDLIVDGLDIQLPPRDT
jgi:hypothetical protein